MGALVVFAAENIDVAATTSDILGLAGELIHKAAGTAKFKGRTASVLDILTPAGLAADRLLVAGTAQKSRQRGQPPAPDYLGLGGFVGGKLSGRHARRSFSTVPNTGRTGCGGRRFRYGAQAARL